MHNCTLRKKQFLGIIFFLFCKLLIAQTFNRPVPSSIYPYEFNSVDTNFYGYYFTSPFSFGREINDPEYKFSTPMILDEKGYVMVYFPTKNNRNMDFKYFPDHQLYGYISIMDNDILYTIFDANFNLINTFTNSPDIGTDIHELLVLENGNYAICGFKNDTVDLSGHTIDGTEASSNTVIKGFVIEEFDTNNNLVFQWNSNDYIDPLDAYDEYGYDPDNYDYCHGNAIEEDDDGNFLISLRHLNAVYKIDRATGDVIWVLGGKSSDFTFPDDSGFSGQHDIRRLPNGNITVFDNANTSESQISRSVEYYLDTTNWTANLVWEYIDPEPFFARAMGSHQTTTERNHLINYGLLNRPYPSVSFVDDNKNNISNIYFQDQVLSYRSYIYKAPIHVVRPKINCSKVGNSIVLSVPSEHDEYVWSNGDETKTTTITTPGVYQVWVDNGLTMVGSLPVEIKNMNASCSEIQNVQVEKTIVGVYDILGREVKQTKLHQLYIIHYSDNSSKKVVYTN